MSTPAWLRSSSSYRSKFWDNPFQLITRILAVLGLLLLVERISSFYVLNAGGSHASISAALKTQTHPLDQVLDHKVNNTGHGVHVGNTRGKKSIVVASTSREDTQWVHDYFPDWEINVYVVDNQTAELTVFKNRGREAAVYLTYLINHYYNLPDYMVFLHADRYQWHNEDPMYDGVNPVKNLRLQHVRDVGYASLRCSWNPGCPVGLHPKVEGKDDAFGIAHSYAAQFQEFFPGEPVPKEIGAPCCAQFAISRERALERPIGDYERIRQWLWDTGMGSGKSGRVLEYMWHKLFKMDDIHCPTAQDCFCNTFGLCNLTCPGPARCAGRWHLPPWNKGMPAGWPHHGQGTNGYPKWGWWQKWYPNEEWNLGYAKEDLGPLVDNGESAPDAGPDMIDEAAIHESSEDIIEDVEEITPRRRRRDS